MARPPGDGGRNPWIKRDNRASRQRRSEYSLSRLSDADSSAINADQHMLADTDLAARLSVFNGVCFMISRTRHCGACFVYVSAAAMVALEGRSWRW
jgi:hypothetical protein